MNSNFENLIAVDNFEVSGEGQIIENIQKNIFEKKLQVDCKYINLLNLITI